MGGPHHYFLKGTGRIVVLGEQQVGLALSDKDSEQTEIVLVTSMIFGNEILNATGLVKHSQFKRTNEYNAVSAEVNKIVESELASAFVRGFSADLSNSKKPFLISQSIASSPSSLFTLAFLNAENSLLSPEAMADRSE